MKTISLVFALTLLALPAMAADKKMSAKPAASGDSVATIKNLEDRWEAAYLKHDTTVLEEVIATDYAGVGHDGKLMNKAAIIAEMKNDSDTINRANLNHMKIRAYGANAAVAIGDAHEEGKDKAGKAFDRTYRYTDTWVERNGKWQCVAEQVMQTSGK